jgi:hypothetical protein
MTTSDETNPNQTSEPTLYKISFDKLEALGRSPVYVLATRLPEEAPSANSSNYEQIKPQKLVDEIAKHSKIQQDYIHTDMPLQEMIFRILLAKRNRPMALTDIHHDLTEKWSTPIRPITVTQTGLRRILETDTYYGFVSV